MVSNGVSVRPSIDVEWKLFVSQTLPRALYLFLMEVFHLQLRVRARMVSFVHTDNCPICGQVETFFHAIAECKHHQLISEHITRSCPPMPYKGFGWSIFKIPLVCRLNYSSGLCRWMGVYSHWKMRNYVKMSSKVAVVDLFLQY